MPHGGAPSSRGVLTSPSPSTADDGWTVHAGPPLQTPPVARLEAAGSVLPLIGPSGRKFSSHTKTSRAYRPDQIRPRGTEPTGGLSSRQTRSLPEPFNPRLRAQLSGVASLASEGMSMVSNETRHKIGAALAHLAASAVRTLRTGLVPACRTGPILRVRLIGRQRSTAPARTVKTTAGAVETGAPSDTKSAAKSDESCTYGRSSYRPRGTGQ